MMSKLRIAIALTASAAIAPFAYAADADKAGRLEDLTVMALSAIDGRAVIKTADGKMLVLKVNDGIPGTQAVLTQVLNDKIVVEDQVLGADKKPRKQTVWVSKAANAGAKSTVQRLQDEPPATDTMLAKPTTVEVTPQAQPPQQPKSGKKTK
jgi:hypothetical protein